MNQLRACHLTIGCAAMLWLNRCVPDAPSITEEDTKPFVLPGGSNAALLVHGFPGSPAQMRPLGEALQARGWTVQGIYIPGGSGGFNELSKLSGTEWTQTVSKAATELAQVHPRLLVIGYSMGAAMTCAKPIPPASERAGVDCALSVEGRRLRAVYMGMPATCRPARLASSSHSAEPSTPRNSASRVPAGLGPMHEAHTCYSGSTRHRGCARAQSLARPSLRPQCTISRGPGRPSRAGAQGPCLSENRQTSLRLRGRLGPKQCARPG